MSELSHIEPRTPGYSHSGNSYYKTCMSIEYYAGRFHLLCFVVDIFGPFLPPDHPNGLQPVLKIQRRAKMKVGG